MTRARGLTLGKYAPLHRGHQLVIETALAEADELVVIIYDCPEATRVPLNVRADWIRRLYPQVRVIEAWDGPTEVGDAPDICRRHEDYVIRRLGISGVTHFYSSEFYGEHMSRALGAANRLVDPGRSSVPVSGTAVRRDPFAHREHLHPIVYRDLVTNVALLGAPSTGKTALAGRLAREYGTRWMPEYGREYWERHQAARRLTPEQLVEIAEGHLEREEALLYESDRYLFTDTNALTTYVFAQYYHGSAPARLAELALLAASRYDLVFLCGDDIPYEDTWDRSGEVNRRAFQKRVAADLAARKIPFFTLYGTLDERVRQVKGVLGRYEKYANLIEPFGPGQS
jgi:HTH-type transcriptional regulator, transcriptional repressor of NAD biosynthesis genes